jgi:hypothetical protein
MPNPTRPFSAWPALLLALLPMPGCPQAHAPAEPRGAVATEEPKGPAGSGPAVGVNLVYQAYWSSQQPFVDLFRGAGPWLPQRVEGWEWDTGEPLDLDADGWIARLRPGQAAGTLMARGLRGRYPGGRYRLYHTGRGKLELMQDGRIVGRGKDHLEVVITPSDAGVQLKLLESDSKDPLRDIRLVPEGFADSYAKQPFRPEFLEFLRPFSTLRFMDWQRTNDSKLARDDQRTRAATMTQAGDSGVALELCVELLNALDKDGWFCVPHELDDEGVRAMAEQVAEHLEPGRVAFVELSNEVWNDQFSQARWAQERGLERRLSSNPFEARLRAYSERAVEVFAIWKRAFGAGAERRLVRVLAGQSANPWTAEVILSWKDAHRQADAYAVAPYFGHGLGAPERQGEVAAASEEQLFAWLSKDVDLVLEQTRENARVARRFGLPLIAYEGGQHLAGHGGAQSNRALTERFHAANRSPRMGQLYGRYLAGWKAAGGRLFCHWNSIETYSEWGSWGLVEFVDQPRSEAPKLDALLDFAEGEPRWW